VPFLRTGNLIFTSGQVAVGDAGLIAEGIVGREVDLATAQQCARQCAINILAQLKAAVGELSAVEQIVKLTVFVASAPDFTSQHLVANGASELMAEVFGDAGRHARSAVGAPSLPTNTPVEVEAIVSVRG
jgi:enamine deaminase RidA (YjgF/YER057c/UK114 family)